MTSVTSEQGSYTQDESRRATAAAFVAFAAIAAAAVVLVLPQRQRVAL